MAESKSALSTITKVIFIGGAILLFVFLAIWVIRLVPKAINGVANIGDTFKSDEAEQIVVSTNKSEVSSGEIFVLSFEYKPTAQGEYYFSYSCEETLVMDIESRNGPKRVLCDSPFKLGNNINKISLKPNLSRGNIFVDTEIEVFYRSIESGDDIATGSTIITLKNTSDSDSDTTSNPYSGNFAGSTVTNTPVEDRKPTNTQTTTKTTTSTNYTPSYYGSADLAITNIANTRNQSALSFTVYNLGTNVSGNWYFSYTDAEYPSQTLISPIQPSLKPGQGLLIQVRFDGQRNERQTINIFVDSTNSVYETNESNNYSSVVINGNVNNNGGSYNSGDDADLALQNLKVGRMSGNKFVEDDDIDEDDDAAISFTVKNIGGETTGSWRFEINNTPNDDDYKSGRQESLRPGESIEFTIEFENPDEGTYNIEVIVDSEDDVDEENERNNDDSERLRVRR